MGALLVTVGCSPPTPSEATPAPIPVQAAATSEAASPPNSPRHDTAHLGFDANDYPGDEAMSALHKTFAFSGYWLTAPPGADGNQWKGKRDLLKRQGWGFLVLANGKLEKQILKAARTGTAAGALGRQDAATAIESARAEGFPAHTILFLDQEEGGRLTVPQAAYLLAWTEAVARSDFRPGVYASGQPVPDDPGKTVTTVEDIRERVRQQHLHAVEVFTYRDDCPPAPGCTLTAKPLAASGTADALAWQYSQSPRRPAITKSCAATYAADGNCYPPGFPAIPVDMDVAASADPSSGR